MEAGRLTKQVAEVVHSSIPKKKKKRMSPARAKYINKIRSISARCKKCETLIVMRVQWTPKSLFAYAEEIIEEVKTCHNCGRLLEIPKISDIRFTLVKED